MKTTINFTMLQAKLHSLAAITKKLTWRNVRRNLTTAESKKALTLYGSQILGLGFAFAAQKLNTKYLPSPEEYGVVTACLAIFTFVYTFFEFGIFSSGARLLARAASEDEAGQIWGTLLVVTAMIIVSFSLLIGLFSLVFGDVFADANVRRAMTFASLLAWVFPLQFFLQETIPGSQRMYELSLYTLLSKGLYALGIVACVGIWSFNATISLMANLAAMGVSASIILYLLRPRFRRWRVYLPELRREVREYGWYMYIGRVFASPAFNLVGLLMPYLGGTSASALYSVGGNLTTPMVQASQSISSTLYKNFGAQRKLKARLLLINSAVLLAIGSAIFLFAPQLIHLSANAKYEAAVPFILPLVIAGFFQGFYQPLSLFVAAHGKGKWTRQILIAGTVIDVASSIVMILHFGVWGAVWQGVISKITWTMLYVFNYRRTTKLLATHSE